MAAEYHPGDTKRLDCFQCGKPDDLQLGYDGVWRDVQPETVYYLEGDKSERHHGIGLCTITNEELELSDQSARVLADQFQYASPVDTPAEC